MCCSTKVAGRAQAGTAFDKKRRGAAEAAAASLLETPSDPVILSIAVFFATERVLSVRCFEAGW